MTRPLFSTAARARAGGASLGDIVRVAVEAARADADVARRLRLWAADCAAHVLHIYERTGDSEAPRAAIIAARRYARGGIGADELAAARAAAELAVRATASVAAWDAAADSDAEDAWQFDRLILWLSDDEPEDWPLPPRNGEAGR